MPGAIIPADAVIVKNPNAPLTVEPPAGETPSHGTFGVAVQVIGIALVLRTLTPPWPVSVWRNRKVIVLELRNIRGDKVKCTAPAPAVPPLASVATPAMMSRAPSPVTSNICTAVSMPLPGMPRTRRLMLPATERSTTRRPPDGTPNWFLLLRP